MALHGTEILSAPFIVCESNREGLRRIKRVKRHCSCIACVEAKRHTNIRLQVLIATFCCRADLYCIHPGGPNDSPQCPLNSITEQSALCAIFSRWIGSRSFETIVCRLIGQDNLSPV